jgi:hypothetical protein
VPAKDGSRWTLAELIDFESALSSWDGKARPDRRGGERAAVMRRWLASREEEGPGSRWLGGIGAASAVLGVFAALAGGAAVWGTLDRASSGVNVIWMLGGALVLPWGFIVAAACGWLLRGRVPAIGLVGGLVERLSLRFVRAELRAGLDRIRRSGELLRVLAWHLAVRTQLLAAAFHAGAFGGLGAMVLFKHVGFFWETTTESAMRTFLDGAVRVLSLPWASWLPRAVPDVEASRLGGDWMEGGAGWWSFSLLALLVWGIVPRLLLAGWMGWRKRRALERLTFQAPHHRKLWRELNTVQRGEEPKGPVDGALVISVGGAEPDVELLRPFMLRRLRMNPTGWQSLGVLDRDREEAAREALAKAPAGIVLLAEGWSLAPRQMDRALAEVASRAGERRRVLLVADPGKDGIGPVTDEERAQWERFVDERGGEELELVFYDES